MKVYIYASIVVIASITHAYAWVYEMPLLGAVAVSAIFISGLQLGEL